MEFSNQSMNIIFYALIEIANNKDHSGRYAAIKALEEWKLIDSDIHTKKEYD